MFHAIFMGTLKLVYLALLGRLVAGKWGINVSPFWREAVKLWSFRRLHLGMIDGDEGIIQLGYNTRSLNT